MPPEDETVGTGAEQREQDARELSQLMRLQERLLSQLQEVRTELATPATAKILREVRNRTGAATDETFGKITAAVEEALRALKVFEAELKEELFDDPDELTVEGVPELPAHLARFLAERTNLEGFDYEVRKDPLRGWIIRWKEYAADGTVRGCGQIYERPHAWLEE